MWEFLQHFSHFITAFATSNIDDDFCIRPLSNAVLGNRLARTERARNTSSAAFCNREESIQNTLTCDQRNIRTAAIYKRPRAANRPALKHGDFFFLFAHLQL